MMFKKTLRNIIKMYSFVYLDNGGKNSVHFFTAYSFLLYDNQTESSIDVCIEIIERGKQCSFCHYIFIHSFTVIIDNKKVLIS